MRPGIPSSRSLKPYPMDLPPDPEVREPEIVLVEIQLHLPEQTGDAVRFTASLIFNGPCQLDLQYGIMMKGQIAPLGFHPIMNTTVGPGRFKLEVVQSLHSISYRTLPAGDYRLVLRINGNPREVARFQIPSTS